MSKDRLMKILDEFHEDYNCLCYQYDKELNRFYLYENGDIVAEFFLNNYVLVMPDETGTSAQLKKVIRLATAKYIVQEDELRNKKFKYKVPNFLSVGGQVYLVRCLNDEYFFNGFGAFSDDDFQSQFTDAEMEELIKEHGDDFKKFIELCEKVEVD